MSSDSLPMPSPTISPFPLLTTFKVLAFDIYGTLIDWETSILSHLQPLLSQLPANSPLHDKINLASLFNQHEHHLQQTNPTMLYSNLLTQAYLNLASSPECNVPITPELQSSAEAFGSSIESWEPFPDTVSAMIRLSKYYKLIPLSNVDKQSFNKTLSGPLRDVPFWRYYVAEEIGSYKPDIRNFEYLISHADADAKSEGDEKGVEKEEILMVAQSLMHDHVPAKKVGLSSVWVNRKGAGMGVNSSTREGNGGGDGEGDGQKGWGGGVQEMHERGEVGYGIRVGTLGEFADLVDEAWKGK